MNTLEETSNEAHRADSPAPTESEITEVDPGAVEPEDWLVDWKYAQYGEPTILVMCGEIREDETGDLIGLSLKEQGQSVRIRDLKIEAIEEYDHFTHQKPQFSEDGVPLLELQ